MEQLFKGCEHFHERSIKRFLATLYYDCKCKMVLCQIYTAVLHGRYQIFITVVPLIVGGKFTLHCPQQDDYYLICIGPWGIFLHEIPEMWRYLLVCVCVYVSEQKVCCELLKLFDQTLWVGSRPCKLVYMCKWWCHRLKVK